MNTYVYVDTVVFTVNQDRSTDESGEPLHPADRLEVLVMHRPEAPAGVWALPGSLAREDEDLPDTALRTVRQETGLTLKPHHIHQVGAYGSPDRDSRWRAVSIAYMALLPRPDLADGTLEGHSDGAQFRPYRSLRHKRPPVLEFDHHEIIYDARKAALRLLEDRTAVFSFLPKKFSMTDMRLVYEAFLQQRIDPANFRRKVEKVEGLVVPLDEWADSTGMRGRPAQLYTVGPRGRATPSKETNRIDPPIRFRRMHDGSEHAAPAEKVRSRSRKP